MKFNRYFVFLLLFPTFLQAQRSTYFLSVDELFQRGVENSLRIKASHLHERIADEKGKTALTLRLPDVNVEASFGYIGQPTIFANGLSHATHPDTPDWSHHYKIEISQPIYKGGKTVNTIRRANLEKQIALLSTSKDQAELKLLLLQQYIDLFTLYKQKAVFARNIEESKLRLKDIQKMWKEGVVTRNDAIRSEIQLTNDKLAYQEVDNNIYIVSQQLDMILGLDETLQLLPDTTLLYKPVTLQSCDNYISQAYNSYPELRLARYDTQLALTDQRLIKADYLPSLSVCAGNVLERPITSNMADKFINNWNIALRLSYNLSSLYHNKHKVRSARLDFQLQKNAEEQMMQNIRTKVRSAYIRHQEALDKVKMLLQAVKQAEDNYRIVHNRYLNQLSILTDLLDASSIRLQEELQLTTARTNVVYTYYQLQRICGNL
ncbi:MAG: TolC family protein [Bacteroidaceae bacterium]